jgi:hypothetical protein
MANSVMLVSPPGALWTADPDDFAATARVRWPDAEISEPHDANGYRKVWIQIMPAGEPTLDCTLAVDATGDGSFTIRSGESPLAIEMFTWVREWLGPDNVCVILNTGTGMRLGAVPYGVDADELAAIVASVAPR